MNISPTPLDDIITGKWYCIRNVNDDYYSEQHELKDKPKVLSCFGTPFKVIAPNFPFLLIEYPDTGKRYVIDTRFYNDIIPCTRQYVKSYYSVTMRKKTMVTEDLVKQSTDRDVISFNNFSKG